PYQPSASDQNMLLTQRSTAISCLKSCSLALSDVGGKTRKADTTKTDPAHVSIEGTEVPLSATNGWNVDMAAPTTLVFSGSACMKWQIAASTKIDLQFPCGSIIFE